MNLTRDLAADLAADNALLFVGDSLRDAAAPLPLTQIAELLAQQISYDRPDRSLTAVARDFEALRGRQPLVQALRDALRQLALQPSALHELLAQAVLPSSKIITTAYDALLEDAPVSYTHLRAHETVLDLVCRLLLEKKKNQHYLVSSQSNADYRETHTERDPT